MFVVNIDKTEGDVSPLSLELRWGRMTHFKCTSDLQSLQRTVNSFGNAIYFLLG